MSLTCPYCRTGFEEHDEIVACPDCATQHHADCLRENGGCTVFGCSQAPVEEPKISISDHDLVPVADRQSSQNAPSFFGLSGGAPIQTVGAIETSTVPPPPRIPGTSPPPPTGVIHSNHVPVMTYPTFGGYAAAPPEIHSQTPRKSRVSFVLLAVFLGAFGGHNFYAGYVKRAVIQLCITLFSCFFGAVISWIWAIVEACMVDSDSDGIAFI